MKTSLMKIMNVLKFAVLIMIILIPVVFAGETYKIDFSKNNQFLALVEKGDRIEFELNNERHTIIIREINQKSADITTFLNLNTQNTPYYATIGYVRGQAQPLMLKLDTNKDNIDDLYVSLKSSNGTKAGIYLVKPLSNEITGKVIGSMPAKPDYYWMLIPAIIVVLLVFVLTAMKKKSKK